MGKYCVPVLFAVLAVFASDAAAQDKKPVFKSLHCGICHKADTGRVYPSLKEITKVYNGDREKLESYLKGTSDPIVNKEKSQTMEKYIEKTKDLSEEEIKSLAEFILSHKD